MLSGYDRMLALAQTHSFNSFTDLQALAFRTEGTYDNSKDLFVVGATSSGKTLIPLLLYEADVIKAESSCQEPPKMLFAVPYRALAAQKAKEMKDQFAGKNLRIVQSTGEFRQDDDSIQNAQVDIAVVITEKIFRFASRTPEFLSKYDYLVLDEFGLVNNADRGIRLDFILAWAKNQKLQSCRLRIIALGTPFFDWSAYIKSYDFTEIQAGTRPVELSRVNVIYGSNGIIQVEGECDFLYRVRKINPTELQNMRLRYSVPSSVCDKIENETKLCPIETPCRSDPNLMCPVTDMPCINRIEFVPNGRKKVFQEILLQICSEHLLAGQQVLVFVNDRAKVVEYCSFLYNALKKYLPPAPPPEECRQILLEECRLEGDDVFGIMESDGDKNTEADLYQAFVSGIGFHSAALPNELRTFVEEKLLEKRDMRIVCSTETLAYGVNSSVDVVIIADLYKNENNVVRPLTLNEFQNYSGRAGRIHRDADFSDVKGYVYTLIRINQQAHWAELKGNQLNLEKLYSLFHNDDGQFMPFFLLNLLPSTSESSMTASELMQVVHILPRDEAVSDNVLERKMVTALEFLEHAGLAVKVSAGPAGRGDPEPRQKQKRYCLTGSGIRMRGFIIGRDDYESLLSAIGEYLNGLFLESDILEFLFKLLSTKHAEVGLNSIYNDSETRITTRQVRQVIKRYVPYELNSDWVDRCGKPKIMFILAALLEWGDGASAKYLYRQYGIHYALLSKLAEQIGYLIEIAKEMLPTQLEYIFKKNARAYSMQDISLDDCLGAADKKQTQMYNLFVSIYYGINTKITQDLLDYLQAEVTTPNVYGLMEELSLQHINPISARKLRRIVTRYKFFENPPEVDMTDVEQRNNFADQYRRYTSDVVHFGPEIMGFFQKRFGDRFSTAGLGGKIWH